MYQGKYWAGDSAELQCSTGKPNQGRGPRGLSCDVGRGVVPCRGELLYISCALGMPKHRVFDAGKGPHFPEL